MRNIPGTEYISKHKGGFQIEKSINGHKKYFGFGRTLIEALMMRDYLESTNWDMPIIKLNPHRHINQLKNGNYTITRKINGKTRYYGHFLNLDEAMKYRDFLESKGWSTNHRFCRNSDAGIHLNKCGSYEVFHYHNGKNEYYGAYYSLEEARRVKKLCIKYNGDWDLIVEEPQEFTNENIIHSQTTFEKKKARDDSFLGKRSGIYGGLIL